MGGSFSGTRVGEGSRTLQEVTSDSAKVEMHREVCLQREDRLDFVMLYVGEQDEASQEVGWLPSEEASWVGRLSTAKKANCWGHHKTGLL